MTNTLERTLSTNDRFVRASLLDTDLDSMEDLYQRCFTLLLSPGRSWLRQALSRSEMLAAGKDAFERFEATGSTRPTDYEDLAEGLQPWLHYRS